MQMGMIFNSLATPASGVDIEHITIDFREPLDVQRFVYAWTPVLEKYGVLRSLFSWEGLDVPKAQIQDEFREIPYTLHDLSSYPQDQHESFLQDLLLKDRKQGFELSKSTPMRLLVICLAESHFKVVWSFHHALLDGRSFPLVLDSVLTVYDGKTLSAESEEIDYPGFVKRLADDSHSNGSEFWINNLRGFEEPSIIKELGRKGIENAGYSPTHALVERVLPNSVRDDLEVLAESLGCTLNNIIQAAWSLLLMHHCGRTDVLFGTTRALRHAFKGCQNTVGLLINTVPFRVNIDNDSTLSDLISQCANLQREIRIAETDSLSKISSNHTADVDPLFASLLMFDSKTLGARMQETESGRSDTRQFEYQGQTNFPLSLIVYGKPELALKLEYKMDLLTAGTCEIILEQLVQLLEKFPSNRLTQAVRVPYLSQSEINQLARWNDTSRSYDLKNTLQKLFEDQVRKTPDAPAVTHGETTLSYSEFNRRANQYAHMLRDMGVVPDELVGVYIERSLEMLIAIYAVIKAGGAYVPFEIDAPKERTEFLLDDAGVRYVFSSSSSRNRIPDSSVNVITIDDNNKTVEKYSEENLVQVNSESDVAYMLYTSGSTGKPKGVMNEHRGIVNRLFWMQDAFSLTSSDIVLQKTPITFDVSVWELFWPLQVGSKLVICEPDAHKDAVELIDIIRRQQVTTLHFVPSMLQLFTEVPDFAQCDSLKKIICSGEALPRTLQDRVFSQMDSVELHNLYGPTEAAIDVTWWQCDKNSALSTVPIGKAISNTQIHILSEWFTPVPVGAIGELHIAGVQVARGYKNRQQLTEDRFVENPFDSAFKMYRSGDLARFMPDGNIEYIGRKDFQVKLRGQRIELGEIEQTLRSDSSVSEAIVTVTTDPAGEQVLVAYLTGNRVLTNNLKSICESTLSPHMVPDFWVVLNNFPLNSSGKVDRKKLPDPKFSDIANVDTATSERILSEDATTQRLYDLWVSVLGRNNFSLNQTFFEAGGNSLLIIRLSNQISSAFGLKISVQDLMRETTVERQASLVRDGNESQGGLEGVEQSARHQIAARRRRRPQRPPITDV